jgi:hypothetical protein
MSSYCIFTKIGFNPSSGSEEDFQRFPIFNQLEAMAAIFNIRQGQRTQFWKGSIQRVP